VSQVTHQKDEATTRRDNRVHAPSRSYTVLVGAHRIVKLDYKTFDAELCAIVDRYKYFQEKALVVFDLDASDFYTPCLRDLVYNSCGQPGTHEFVVSNCSWNKEYYTPNADLRARM
jgi:hypothetical protein